MTQRIGLRHVSRVIKRVPPYECPVGEQIINGGFEAGGANWTQELPDPMYAVFVGGAHTGALCAYPNLWMDTYWAYRLSQAIDNLPAYCVQSFSCWYYQYVYANRAYLRAYYIDDTYSEVKGPTVGSWAQISLTPTASKILNKIAVGNTGGRTKIDDVSLISA